MALLASAASRRPCHGDVEEAAVDPGPMALRVIMGHDQTSKLASIFGSLFQLSAEMQQPKHKTRLSFLGVTGD